MKKKEKSKTKTKTKTKSITAHVIELGHDAMIVASKREHLFIGGTDYIIYTVSFSSLLDFLIWVNVQHETHERFGLAPGVCDDREAAECMRNHFERFAKFFCKGDTETKSL